MRSWAGLSLVLTVFWIGCSSGDVGPFTAASGGTSGIGGTFATGGTGLATGGMSATGGASVGGGSSCAATLSSCSGVCVSTASDALNCGMCGKTCASDQSCLTGTCSCAPGLSACADGCRNLVSDASNCGMCGTTCEGGLFCSQNMCTASCGAGEEACGQSCSNPLTDATNCGFCGNTCPAGQGCTNGACGCPSGQTTCAGQCADLQNDAANCGMCGRPCTGGEACIFGQCQAETGAGGSGAGGAGNAGGNGPGSGGSGGGSVVNRPNGCPITPGLIADFEDGGAAPVVIASEGRTGEWEIFNDETSSNQMMKIEPSGGTDMCDQSALHVTGSNYSSWGAGVGFSLVGAPSSPTAYNATTRGFTGLRFKAKLGTGADSKSPVRFNLSTPWTESSENPGGQCTATSETSTKAGADCYQHAGRFLTPGSGAGALTSSWKDFTYCFDRDLYPLSLPSNLTTDQRNNLGTNILKVQFQFNQGKDYSGPYPSDGQFTEFSKALPFDLWLDDVEFFSGDCPNVVATPSNSSPAKPFPQNAAVGSCATPAVAPKFAAAIAEIYAHWTTTFVQNDRIAAPEQQGTITSEAMGYGMMIAAAMGDKTAFDKFHGYVKGQGGTGSGLMTWKNGGSGSASDGDIDIAYALLMGHLQWPSGGYKTPSDQMAAAILSQDLVSNVIRGGSTFKDAPFNPSYFSPAAFRAFGSSFGSALTTNFNLVNGNINATTAGVPTDWASPSNGAPSGPGSAQVTSEIIDGNNGAMGYDAARVPWRLGLDVCKSGNASAALTTMVNFFAAKYDQGASIDLMKAGWYKTTGQPHPASKDFQGSYLGPIGVGALATGNTAMRDRAFRVLLDILENGDYNHTYFPSTVGLLTLLLMSGNFPMP